MRQLLFELSDGSESFREAAKVWLNTDAEPLRLRKTLPPLSEKLLLLLRRGVWEPMLPLCNPQQRLSLGEGDTPLLQLEWEGRSLWVKNEFQNPTGSFKDRGAAIMISRAIEEKVAHVVEDSSGNAGCAVAAYAAAAGIPCTVFVPEKASRAKLRMIEAFGALLRRIPGPRHAATEASFEATNSAWFASHVWNPWFLEGTKIFAYEIWHQTQGRLPDEIIFPCGNGTLLLGSYIGFEELKTLGLSKSIPALSAAFSEECAPLVHPEGPFGPTCAEGIAVTQPVRAHEILSAVSRTGGRLYAIPEAEICDAHREAALRGLYLEFTAAVALAAVRQASQSSQILVPLTGSGLKNP